MKHSKALLILLIGLLVSVPIAVPGSQVLGNARIRLTVLDDGSLQSVENFLAEEKYAFSSDVIKLETDRGVFSNRTTTPVLMTANARELEFRYKFGSPGNAVEVKLTYRLEPDNTFFRRWLTISNETSLRMKNLILGETVFAMQAREVLHYVTFIAAPTVEFVRHENGGFFTGIENPYFKTDFSEHSVALSFEPALILKPGEGYVSEPQFLGVYRKCGVWVEDSGREFRYNANGSGYKPLDRNEIRAMRSFALDYLSPTQKGFLNINYQFFHPLPQMPRTQKDKDYFTKTIDSFAAIEGDMIIFKPLHPYIKPDVNRAFWDLVPGDTAHVARQVVDYARGKGLSYGFYMGCAAHGNEGNAGGLNFRPDKPAWKKSDAAGRRAPDNCLACDEFFEWWFTVQNNTIQKYNLSNWSWDPSLGSGMNCHDESHGHLADQGGYKGWRRSIELMARLKAARPGLFIQGFYGTKNFGLWGLKNVDQHEVLNEQSIIVSTRHNQISDDRQNADGLRFQNNWSMRFRFTPAVMGHALTHRVSEGGFDPELIKAWDYAGWKYGVMSSLAVAGTLMPTILPYETDLVPGYVDFYKKWQRWARDNFDSVNMTEPFGEQVQPGAVDGYARIKGERGFVFLFNGNPRPCQITFEVGDEINLQKKGDYQFVEIYPSESKKLILDDNGKSRFAYGEKASLTVPANECCLLEMQPVSQENKPVITGAGGEVTMAGARLEITGLADKPGAVARVHVQVPEPRRVGNVTVNGMEHNFTRTESEICLNLQFAGESFVRALDDWTQVDSKRFDFPYHSARSNLKLTTTFTLNAGVRQLLENARPKNFEKMDAKIARWQMPESKRNASYSYHNFIGERPSQLWLIIPFLRQTEVEVTFNRHKMSTVLWDSTSSCAFADVTELAQYGANNRLELFIKEIAPNTFMGPFLLYPEEPVTNQLLPTAGKVERRVIYDRPLVAAPSTRYRKGAGPTVTEARMLDHVTLTEPATLRVKLDLPPEKVRRVMFFESGFGWMGQHPLDYNSSGQCWIGNVSPGNRAAIQENEFIYVWAEGVDGLRSEYTPVKVGWDFTTGRNK